jgi:hypothetical protein
MGCAASQSSPAVAPKIPPDGSSTGSESDSLSRRKSVVIETREQLDFIKVMDDATALGSLLKFAKSEFNEEVLLLWISIFGLKRDLAQVDLWNGEGGGGSPANGGGAAPTPAGPAYEPPPPEAEGNPFDAGAPDIFGGDNMFDEDGATHSASTADELAEINALLGEDRPPPPEATTGDRDGYLRRRSHEIIDRFLCNGAEFEVTLGDAEHPYKNRSDKQSPPYELGEQMFDSIMETIYKSIKQETWMRFRLTDAAEALAIERPQLLLSDPERDTLAAAPSISSHEAVLELRETLRGLTETVGCERATVWLVNRREGRLWNVASTHLGNSIISIRMSHGLAGKAASTSTDLISNDVQTDAAFLNRIDKETKFESKSICCVVLTNAKEQEALEPAAATGADEAAASTPAHVVVQLINKKGGGDGGGEGQFSEADVASVHGEVGDSILATCNSIHLHQLILSNPKQEGGGGARAGAPPTTATSQVKPSFDA